MNKLVLLWQKSTNNASNGTDPNLALFPFSPASLQQHGVEVQCIDASSSALVETDLTVASPTTSIATESSSVARIGKGTVKVFLLYGAALATEAAMKGVVGASLAGNPVTALPVILTAIGGYTAVRYGSWFGEGDKKAFVLQMDEEDKYRAQQYIDMNFTDDASLARDLVIRK